MIIYIFLLILILIIISSYIYGGHTDYIHIYTQNDEKYLRSLLPHNYFMGHHPIYGYGYRGHFLLYENNKIRYFSPFFTKLKSSKEPAKIQNIIDKLLSYYTKNIINKNLFKEVIFQIYHNEQPHLDILDPTIFGKKYKTPVFKFRYLYQYIFSNIPNTLSYTDLLQIEKTGKRLTETAQYFFGVPESSIGPTIKWWYNWLKEKKIDTVLYYAYSLSSFESGLSKEQEQINLLCALYMRCKKIFFAPVSPSFQDWKEKEKEKEKIMDKPLDKYKNTLSIYGTFYKNYDAIFKAPQKEEYIPPTPCKYIVEIKNNKPILKENKYKYDMREQIIDIKNLYKYPYMKIDKIQNTNVYLKPHEILNNQNIKFPFINNLFCWDMPLIIYKRYKLLDIIDSSFSSFQNWKERKEKTEGICLGIIDSRVTTKESLLPITYFNEKERLKCKRKNQPFTVFEYFNKAIKDKNGYFYKNFENLIEENNNNVYVKINYIACSEFNPEWAYTLIKKYGARRVLDMSAGRGARMLGAMLAGCDFYLGIDPNEKSNKANRTMGAFYKHMLGISTNFMFIDAGFETPWEETIPAKNLIFDMMITSPPYYDLEIYVPSSESKLSEEKTSSRKTSKLSEEKLEKTQSIWNRTFEEWIDEFFIFSICKAIRFIKSGGYIIINIDNSINENIKEDYTTPLITSKKIREAGAQYIGYYRLKDTMPCTFWIFKKN